jgi:hemolysin-activating ACP:hemolysin acyltransferase
MLEPEGKRCWTMQYYEFHMDILPCVPKDRKFIEPNQTAIKLTHKNDELNIYEERYSNPYAYHNWFENRMKTVLLEEKQIYSKRNKVSIEDVPTYEIHTPLQQAIQLLKRHRDIYFENNNDDAPISIIITTLSALAYNNEKNLYEALENIINKMPQFIEIENNLYIIKNPVMPEENFADKWNSNSNKAKAFYDWLNQAKKDFNENPIKSVGIDEVSAMFYETLGKAPVERALKSIAKETHQLSKNNELYINGLLGGITTSSLKDNIIPIKEHTFFGE